MARKALLIGSQTGGLTGVDNDVKVMANALRLWEFACTVCEAEDASRAGILDAYEELIEDAGPNDAIFIYYSGHGGFCRQPDFDTVVRPRAALQFIVPTDFDQTTEGDFRGITSFELSQLQARLTVRTKNVTVALDCCHSAHMSRDRHLRVRSHDRSSPYPILMAHLEALQRRGQSLDRWDPMGNKHAVRMVACAPDQSAYEYNNDAGERNGMFTEALSELLTEAAATTRVTWATIIERVRRQVLLRMPFQRPEAEGPAHRLLFDLAEADPVATYPIIALIRDRARLEGGPLLGLNVGDELMIMPADSPGPDDATRVGHVRVDRLEGLAALGALELSPQHPTMPLGARAHRITAAASRLPVRVPSDDPRGVDLLAAMAASKLVRPAEPEEDTQYEVWIDAAGDLTVSDHLGPLHTHPRPCNRTGITAVIADLERLSRANGLRLLTEESDEALDTPVTVEFGLVEDGKTRPLEQTGEILHLDQRIYVRVKNEGEHNVYVTLLDIGLAAEVTLMTKFAPSGVELRPGKEYVFGENQRTGEFAGTPLTWAVGVPREQPRLETVLVLLTSEPQSAHAFVQPGVRQERTSVSRLEQMLDQIASGSKRNLAADEGRGVLYTVRAIDFDVMPVGAPDREVAPFEVDERPDKSVVLYSARGAGPMRVAVRLSDLIVHHNRAFRSADIRLDTVVLTGIKGEDGRPVYHAQTERFSNIRDGQPLPLDRLGIYHGPAVDYLDIAVWVTRESRDSLALSDLLRDKLTDSETQGALLQLGGMLAAAPQAAVAVAAVGASAIVVNTAYHLLRGVVGDSIGLYRTTLLAHERFGSDRQADQNLVRAQDFSFTYTIENVG